MTKSQSKVESTVPLGGNLKMRIEDVDITNYDDGNNGNGEGFTPSDVNMRRFVYVHCNVKFGSGTATTVQKCTAEYDYSNNSIRLLQQSDNSGADADAELVEVPSNSNEGVEVRCICVGV